MMTTDEIGTRTVLVVDDDPEIREIVCMALRCEGYIAEAAANGEDAIMRIHEIGPPALILLDLSMPVMGGAAFCERQHHDPHLSAIPVVVLSGEQDGREQSARMGADGFLGKPVDLDALLDVIGHYCVPSLSAALPAANRSAPSVARQARWGSGPACR